MNEWIESLKAGYIRKSHVMAFIWCPRRCKRNYVDAVTSDSMFAARRGIAFHVIADSFFRLVEQRWEEFEMIYLEPDPNLDRSLYEFFKELLQPTNNPQLNLMIDNFLEFNVNYFMEYCLNTDHPTRMFMPLHQEVDIVSENLMRKGRLDRISLVPGTEDLYIMDYKTSQSWDTSRMRKELAFYYLLSQDDHRFKGKVTYWSIYNPKRHELLFEPIKKISITWLDKTMNGYESRGSHVFGFYEVLEMMYDEKKWKWYWDKIKRKYLVPIKCVHCDLIGECWD